jgi:hypothetical protein
MKYPVAEIGRLCLQTEQRDPRNSPDLPFEYVDISSIDKDLKTIIHTQGILGKDAPSRARKVIHTGDILISTVRPNLNAVAIVPSELDGQIASTGFCVLRPNPMLIHARYLFYWTLTQDFVNFLTARMQGANYPAVTDEVVRKAMIPLPPLSEQRRIVDILYDSTDHISHSAVEQANLKYINPGSVLIVVRGMILAHTVPIALAGTQLTINQDIKALEPKITDISSMYLYAALRVSDRKILSKVRIAAHGTRKIEMKDLLQLPIRIPSSEDLNSFHRMMTEYNRVVFGIMKSRNMMEQLFKSLLHRAFSGELTAKWREAHIKELSAEMDQQAKWLAEENMRESRETACLQQSLFREEMPK